MGTIKTPTPVKLITGLLAASPELMEKALGALVTRHGPVDVQSEQILFTFTDYYASEMGGSLLRQWVSFERLIDPGALAAVKIGTNEMEAAFLADASRKVNIDPGYLTLANLILASTKDFSHRIYLDRGIYGEVTLIYKGKQFTSLPWTYPDYFSPAALAFLQSARSRYQSQLKAR